MRKFLFAGLIGLTALAACTPSPRTQVERALRYVGIEDRPAKCIAGEMDDRLSPEQMDRVVDMIGKARSSIKGDRSPMTALEAAAQLNDPEIVNVVMKAGLGCMMMN